VNKINDLLPLIKIIRTPSGFEIKRKKGDQVIKADLISSGESEAIALSIEALVFSRECQTSTNRLLLIDEPDVHLHPDLQVRFIRFLEDLAKEKNFKVLIATHSTSVISALKFKTECQVAFMPLDNGDEIKFSEINNIIQSVVPIFGAHPLSNLFNEAPIMLVEGDDDKRIWDQVKRTSEGKVPIFPCSVDGKGEMSKWENWLVDFLSSIYDEPKAYSLRDNDGCSGEIEDKPPIIRMRLHCRTVENLLLTDECFILSGLSWDTFKDNCIKWAKTHASHSHFSYMTSFIDKGFDRKNHDLKKIRNIIVYLMGVSKPWEVLVGQAIVSAMNNNKKISSNSMLTYLGEKVQKNILCL
jgi:hypothetical protein